MRKTILFLLKLIGGTVLTILLLLIVTVFSLNTSAVQNHILQEAVTLLKEKLQTEVSIDRIHVNFMGQDMNLYGVEIEDLQHRKMLRLEELGVTLDLWKLMQHEVKITDASIKGLEANLFKPSKDSAANYQFIIDAFKKKDTVQVATTDTVAKKQKFTVDVRRVWLERIRVSYNNQAYELGSLSYKKGNSGNQVAEIRDVRTAWTQKTKKGPVDTQVSVGVLDLIEMEGRRQLNLEEVHFITNNHKPRKNSGKPKRGFFDVAHFDIMANASISLDYVGKDSVVAVINQFTAKDPQSGIDLRSVRAKVEANSKVIVMKDVTISLPNTSLSFNRGVLQLPNKKTGRRLAYRTSLITGTTRLKDISRVFAPVLKNFNEPLRLQVRMSGDDQGMKFSNVKVNTLRKDLVVVSDGYIRGLKNKYQLQVHFDIHHMTAMGGSKVRIISQFPVKKFMMEQLHNLGRIDYNGHFDVLWKREQFAGRLTTAGGPLDFHFALDENTKYVLGSVKTDSFALGKVIEMEDIRFISCKADFKFDVSKPRTAIMRKKVGGKLPMGEVTAEIPFAQYKKIRLRNIYATIQSNGAIAEGNVTMKGGRVDMLCSFTFTNTTELKKMKIKPGIKFHALTEESKAERELRKAQKAQDKAARKVAKAEDKAIKRAAKIEEKAARKVIKEAEKAAEREAKALKEAAKEAEKAARKAAKAEEKARRKAAKEAEKAAKQAAKENK